MIYFNAFAWTGCFIPVMKNRSKYLNSISPTKVDLPLPLTPVTTQKVPSGNETSIFFKLCKKLL